MPSLKKKAISLYLRTGCQRQLAFNLYSDEEKREREMPQRQEARFLLGLVGQAGYDWQAAKVSELERGFGRSALIMGRIGVGNRVENVLIEDALSMLAPHRFLVEGRYEAGTGVFRRAFGLHELRDRQGTLLEVGKAEPDLIQVLPPMNAREEWEREIETPHLRGLSFEVLPAGDTRALDPGDERLRLRVIDIKQAAEPGANYFAEVVYYSLTLAAWLVERELTNRYAVVAAPAVWPGSYAVSLLMVARQQAHSEAREPTRQELASALENEVEVAPLDVFVPRLRTFFYEELPQILSTPWQDLGWYVSYRCKGCEYLGYPWRDRRGHDTSRPYHCKPMAESSGHLSRVYGLTRGGAQLLSERASDVLALSMLGPGDSAFEASTTLRAKRALYPRRAHALERGISGVIRDSGGDALMPRWPDLRIFVFLEYDLSTAVTGAFSLRARWNEPLPPRSPLVKQRRRWRAWEFRRDVVDGTSVWRRERTEFQEVFIVDRRDVDLHQEREELLRFLQSLRQIISEVHRQDNADVAAGRRRDQWGGERRSTYQIYLWDHAQRKHLERVIGRHLGSILADPQVRDLAWLFPPPELLGHAEDVSYKSPFTYVARVVENTVALPVAHHYTLLDVVQSYKTGFVAAPTVHPHYQEPLSDLIPGERLHQMWDRRVDLTDTLNILRETVERKLDALAHVVMRLERDLAPVLTRGAAPPVARALARLTGVPPTSQLWYEFARLNAALTDLDAHATRAMPPQERVARFKSARLLRRLQGEDKRQAYASLQGSPEPLPPIDEILVYALSHGSRELNARPPAFFALVPTSNPAFLNASAARLVREYNLRVNGQVKEKTVSEAGLVTVTLLAIDRVGGYVAVKPWNPLCITSLESSGAVDLSADVMLDPLGEDFGTKKIKETLQGIGSPPSAVHDESTLLALGYRVPPVPGTSPEGPASEFLWNAAALAQTPVERGTSIHRPTLEEAGLGLDSSQWQAWEAALSRRLTLIWGPPGTGKSRTLRAVVSGAALDAKASGRPLRILISAFTYRAMDHVLFGVAEQLRRLFNPEDYSLARVRSQYSARPSELAHFFEIQDVVPRKARSAHNVSELVDALAQPSGILVVSAIPQQLYNLAVAREQSSPLGPVQRVGSMVRSWFDLVLIDEASQLDVASSSLVVSKAADGAAFVLAGDDLQLSPIHQAAPPKDLDVLVGSVFSYARYYHRVVPMPLQANYRSNETLVTFTRRAGYDEGLHANHRELQLALLEPLPTERLAGWPECLYWTPLWARLLTPATPAVCFVYEDPTAGQGNDFEADAVAALAWLLYGRMDRQLAGELDEAGAERPLSGQSYDEHSFWNQGVGIVTPHRAQMGKIVKRLQEVFPDHDPRTIWTAVDTVERFQGQERDIIIASFGLGDPDLIRSEEDFLYQLNRFNVMASRARAKLIVLLTKALAEHLSDDAEVLNQSRFLKFFVETFCREGDPVTLGYIKEGVSVQRSGVLRTRGFLR